MNQSQEEDLHVKERLRNVQRLRKLVLWAIAILAAAVTTVVQSTWPVDGAIHESIEAAGLVLIGIAVFGRTWCTLYIGGLKSRALINSGPYSISRNPLYMFTFIGAVGVGAQTGSITVSIIFGFITFLVFLPVVLQEEKALKSLFGDTFLNYSSQVPRFGPQISAWRGEDIVVTRPSLLWQTVRDGLVFFLVVPILEVIDWLQVSDVITPVIRLP